MKKYLYLTIIFVYLTISITLVVARETRTQTRISGDIPAAAHLRIFGYTAPSSIVQMSGMRSFGETNSDRTGYFLINDLAISEKTHELCLTTIDAQRRTGFPICIPVEPSLDREIGPLLLSPTLSLSASAIWQNQNEHASGKTIPGQTVSIALFEIPSNSVQDRISTTIADIAKPQVLAVILPDLSTVSDEKGDFSFSLPTSKAYTYRLFVTSNYQDSPTPKSQTVTYMVGPLSSYFISFILPKLLLVLFVCILMSLAIYYEAKTRKFRKWLAWFTEKKLQPAAVRLHLKAVRQSYSFRRFVKSHQNMLGRKSR